MKKLLVMFVMAAICFMANAQNMMDSSMMKDCCRMKNGKMMCMKNGKMVPMTTAMTMKNGTKCMANGECIMKDGKKMKMKEGDCMDMNGKMGKCSMMNKATKKTTEKKVEKKDKSVTYTCPIHSDVTSDKPGKCSKCGMALEKKG
jgi:hypothetical protein